jgi:transcriptional regulator with XRE-family HTH domain
VKDRISQIIKASNVSKAEFSRRLNVSQAFVSQLCSGAANPSDRTIADICRIFDIREEWLRHGLEPMRAPRSREEEIAELVGSTLRGSNEFKKSVVRMICSRTDEELRTLEAAIRTIYEDLQKEDRD